VKRSELERAERRRQGMALMRARWIQAGDEALKHFNETGLHLTGEEVDAWLAKLEAGIEEDPPPCHV
jgi:predicted transcriptional regulator